jgi:hypothetical protein
MSPPVQQHRLKWSDFNERTAAPSPAPAPLLGFFEVAVLENAPGGLVDQEARFVAASTRVYEGRAAFSLPTNRSHPSQQPTSTPSKFIVNVPTQPSSLWNAVSTLHSWSILVEESANRPRWEGRER